MKNAERDFGNHKGTIYSIAKGDRTPVADVSEVKATMTFPRKDAVDENGYRKYEVGGPPFGEGTAKIDKIHDEGFKKFIDLVNGKEVTKAEYEISVDVKDRDDAVNMIFKNVQFWSFSSNVDAELLEEHKGTDFSFKEVYLES